MTTKEVLVRLLTWRWLPFFLPILGTLFFVGAAMLLIPSGLPAESPTSSNDDASVESSRSTRSSTTSSRPRTSTPRTVTTSTTRTRGTPHNARITVPRTGPSRLGRAITGAVPPNSPASAPDEGIDDEEQPSDEEAAESE